MSVAGSFYPSQPEKVNQFLGKILGKPQVLDTSHTPKGKVKALIIPHAGWIYSAVVAAKALAEIQNWSKIPRIILLGPSHFLDFPGVAGGPFSQMETPLGNITLDQDSLESFKSPGFYKNWETPYEREHCLEVQLPFLKYLGWEGTLVPLLFGRTEYVAAGEFLESIRNGDDLIIVSSDLSHFHPYQEARKRDLSLLDSLIQGDIRGTMEGEACGMGPLTALMNVAASSRWVPELLDYRNSGDTSGDKSRVVGYAALSYWEPL